MELSRETLQSRLDAPLQYFDSVESTNTVAQAWLTREAVHGAVVIADEQRTGRGRMGRHWHTPPGSAVAMSIVLQLPADEATRATMIGAVAVAEACEAAGARDVSIKWANDVQIAGRKVCGVLPEAVWEKGKLLGVVLGIGVNIRVPFTGELQSSATSLELHTAGRIDRADFAAAVHKNVMSWSRQAASSALFAAWLQRLNTLGQEVTVDDIHGRAVAVDASGALLVRDEHNVLHRIIAGDVLVR